MQFAQVGRHFGALAMYLMMAASAVLAAEPDPVVGKPVFNNPAGNETEQYAIYQQLARIIDRVPKGGFIEMSWYEFGVDYTTDTASKPNIPLRLVKAHQRGVDVRVVLDNNDHDDGSNSELYPYKTISEELGTSDDADSYIVLCKTKKGCVGQRVIYTDTHAYNHNKFLVASKIQLNDGSDVSNVVFQSSGNLGTWDADTSWNNAITWSDKPSFENYRKYFHDLDENHDGSGVDDYYWVGDSADMYKTHFFPRKETNGDLDQASTDTVFNILDEVECSYTGGDNETHQTDVRIVMWAFSRATVGEKLAELVRDGCWVDIVYAKMEDVVADALKKTDGKEIGLTECAVEFEDRKLKPHSKYMLINGSYAGDQDPRVFTGSHNYAVTSLRNADESLVRIRSPEIHSAYLHDNFYQVRDTCSGKISP